MKNTSRDLNQISRLWGYDCDAGAPSKSLFAWSEWSAMLDEEIKKAQAAVDPDHGEPIIVIGSRRSNAWPPKKARPRRKPWPSIPKPESARRIERRMGTD